MSARETLTGDVDRGHFILVPIHLIVSSVSCIKNEEAYSLETTPDSGYQTTSTTRRDFFCPHYARASLSRAEPLCLFSRLFFAFFPFGLFLAFTVPCSSHLASRIFLLSLVHSAGTRDGQFRGLDFWLQALFNGAIRSCQGTQRKRRILSLFMSFCACVRAHMQSFLRPWQGEATIYVVLYVRYVSLLVRRTEETTYQSRDEKETRISLRRTGRRIVWTLNGSLLLDGLWTFSCF